MNRHVDWARIGELIATHLPVLWVGAAAVTGGLALSALVPDTPESFGDIEQGSAKLEPEVIHEFPLELGTVERVIDGDTYDVQLDRTGDTVRVRLAWTDAPEVDQPYGAEATQWADESLRGRQVVLTAQDVDRYGRMVAQLTVKGDGHLWDASATVARLGLGWVDARVAAEHESLREGQELAADEGAGLWSEPNPVPPWEWRTGKKTNPSTTPALLAQQPREL